MSETTLLLGPFVFREFEVPSRINFGGEQRLAVHRLADGTRVVDVLGRDEARITFSGTFSGSEATLRARSIDELRLAGLPLPLTWDVFFYTVLISEFQADYRNSGWIPYRITCTVMRDEASDLVQPALSLVTGALSDIGIAAAQALVGGVDLSPLLTTLGAPGATVRATVAYNRAQANLAEAQTSINDSVSLSDSALGGMDFAHTATANDGVAGLTSATTVVGRLSSLLTARAYVGRAAINLSNAST